MGKQKKSKKRINWGRALKNNVYMLGLIWKSDPGTVVIPLVATILSAVQGFLLGTYMFQYALNALQENEEIESIIITLVIMFGVSILSMVFNKISNAYRELKTPKIEAYVQSCLQKKASEVELACFENSQFFDTYVKATGEATGRAFAVLNNLMDVIWIIINVASVGTLIATIHPIFLVFAFLPLICTLAVGRRRNRIKYSYDMENKEATRKKDYVRRTFYLADFSKEMRLTDMWRVMFRRMSDSVAQLKEIAKKYGYKMMWFAYLFDFVFDILVYSGSIILAAFMTLITKTILIGDCFVIINSISNIASSINYAGNVFLRLDENSLYVDNLKAFLEYEIKIPEDESAPNAPKMETLSLKNVSFSYTEQGEMVLADINLTLNAGEKIAIVGHNGAGKSTLVKLLLRFYDPTEGKILLNGENIKNYRLSSYRGLYGTVFQDYKLFAISIAENVMLRGDLNEDDMEKVRSALENSGIADKVSSLESGDKTVVTKEFDPKGAVFSGGETQKISIARIFAGNNEIVILDEPTSALDPIAEQKMYQNMFAACEGKTVIFISHRLSSATIADRIYMFENGKIVEQGKHSDLLAKNGKYADMWYKQACSYT